MNSIDLNLKLQHIATMLAIAILTLVLIAAISGIAIAFYYEPTAKIFFYSN